MEPTSRMQIGSYLQGNRSMGSMLEAMHSTSPDGGWPLLRTVRIEQVDTNVLLNNIRKDVERYPRPTGMRLLHRMGPLRLFAPPHVCREVEEKLPTWMRAHGVDPVLARKIWSEDYRTAIRFVDPGSYAWSDRRVRELAGRDPDDVPSAQLAILLGRKVLSEDRDLLDIDLAVGKPWLEMVFATGYVAFGESVQAGAAGVVGLSAQSTVDAVRAAQALSTTPEGRRALMVAGLILVVVVGAVLLVRELHEPSRRQIDGAAKSAIEGMKHGGSAAVGAYFQVDINRRTAETKLAAGVVVAAEGLTLEQSVARALATEVEPMTTRELAKRLWGYERVPSRRLADLLRCLSSLPAFVEVEVDHWELGRQYQ